jgi:tight adherence protein B
MIIFVFLVGVGLVLGLFYGFTQLSGSQERRMQGRLNEIIRSTVDDPSVEALVKDEVAGPLPALDRLVGQTTKGNALARWIDQSGVRVTLSGVLLMALGLAVVGFVLGAVLLGVLLIQMILAACGFAVPFIVLRVKRNRRFRKFEEQFPEALDLMARALKAGHAFATGLKMAADEVEDPVGPEFRKTFDEQNFGLPLKDALANLTERMPSLDVRFFATAVLIQRDTGGNLAEILENLAMVVRERFKILRQVRVYTAHGRFTGYVLLALPAALAVALSFINPDHMNLLFRERIGHMLLGLAAVMQFVGYMWIRQIVKIEV